MYVDTSKSRYKREDICRQNMIDYNDYLSKQSSDVKEAILSGESNIETSAVSLNTATTNNKSASTLNTGSRSFSIMMPQQPNMLMDSANNLSEELPNNNFYRNSISSQELNNM